MKIIYSYEVNIIILSLEIGPFFVCIYTGLMRQIIFVVKHANLLSTGSEKNLFIFTNISNCGKTEHYCHR
jgi:hypothetical protein